MAWRIGIDTGGTFTDVLAFEDQTRQWRATKIWSNPGEVAESINSAIAALEIPPASVSAITYGTTEITNAIVESKLARVAFITTYGFKDVLRIARQKREPLYDLTVPHRAPPPVLEDHCFEVDERCTYDGKVTKPLSESEVVALLTKIPADCEVAAVSFLHSYANGDNERLAANILRRRFAHVSVSHEISPEAREYERSITTILNAAMLPRIRRLVDSLDEMSVPISKLRFFHSAGGLISPQLAEKHPLTLAMSGPAAGAQAASVVAEELKLPYAVALDMGGTTTDCSLIVTGRTSLAAEMKIGSVPIRQPTVAVQSIGAGGGSLVSYSNGRLMVGPESMGANPGPACYLRGGTRPTLTDAAAVLGYFGNGENLDRPLEVDISAARHAFDDLCCKLKCSVEEVAIGTIRVASAMASKAIKAVTMNSGIDARSCALIAFGGAGPMFGPFLAQEIGVDTVIVPHRSSGLSAAGCLTADPIMTRQWTVRLKKEDATTERVERVARDLLRSLRAEFDLIVTHGAKVEEKIIGLLRYPGQSYEIEVPICIPFDQEAVSSDFQRLHYSAYGFMATDPWELVAMRISLRTFSPSLPAPVLDPDSTASEMPSAHCSFDGITWLETRQYRRSRLLKGQVVPGPAIILDEMSTIVIPPEFSASVEGLHLLLRQKANVESMATPRKAPAKSEDALVRE